MVVVEGLEVIDKIAAVETDPYDRPLTPVIIKKVSVLQPVDSTASADCTTSKDSAGTVCGQPKADEPIDL
mgnify:CR=1 FL=1